MQSQTQASRSWVDTVTSGRRAFLQDIEFKWLMAGLGVWVDTDRLHRDAVYAARFIKIAQDSATPILQEHAALLQPCLN